MADKYVTERAVRKLMKGFDRKHCQCCQDCHDEDKLLIINVPEIRKSTLAKVCCRVAASYYAWQEMKQDLGTLRDYSDKPRDFTWLVE